MKFSIKAGVLTHLGRVSLMLFYVNKSLGDSKTPTCKSTNMMLGSVCTNSLQCAKLEARCRSTGSFGEDGIPEKRCLCFRNMRKDIESGKCAEIKDHGLIAFDKINRVPTWEELNPGRPKRPANRLNFNINENEDGLTVNIKSKNSKHSEIIFLYCLLYS